VLNGEMVVENVEHPQAALRNAVLRNLARQVNGRCALPHITDDETNIAVRA